MGRNSIYVVLYTVSLSQRQLAASQTSDIQLTPFYLLFLTTAIAPKTRNTRGKCANFYIYTYTYMHVHIYICMYAPGLIYIYTHT